MPYEHRHVTDNFRDLLVENISEIIYDTNDTRANNISINNPDELYIKTTIPHVGFFCEQTYDTGIINAEDHLKILDEQPDGSYRVWECIGQTRSIFVISVLEENSTRLYDLVAKIKNLLLYTTSLQIFFETTDLFDDYADIKFTKESKTYQSGDYPFRKDLRVEINYKLYRETYAYPADNIIVDLETNVPIENESLLPYTPIVPSETTYENIPNGIQIQIRKL